MSIALTRAATSVKILSMNILARTLWSIVWIGLCVYLVLTLWLGLTGLVYPYQLDYGEGIVLWFAQQLARGQSIYKPLADFPYASSNYPPVAMLLSAALMPVLGDGYTAGRLLNLTSALIVAALIFRIVHAETRNRFSAALAGLFFLGSPYVYHWVPLFRVDLIGLAFSFAGIYFVWKFSQQSNSFSGYWLLATVSFLLALYTKHTLIAAPAAAFLALWMRNRNHAIAFALALGIAGGALYILIDFITRGGFTTGLIESNATVFLFDQLIALLQNFIFAFPILLALALWSLLDRVRAKRFGVLEWYTITSIASLVMAGRVGAWENYFFEAIAIVCVVASFKFQIPSFKLSHGNMKPETLNLILPTLYIIQLALMWHDPRIAADLIAQDFPANRQLGELLRQTSGVVISEDMGALATNGKPVAYYTFQYSSLARSGKWNQQWELNGLRDTKFPLVILERGTREDVDHYRRFTREFVSALDRYYERTQNIGKYEIYQPAPALRLQSAEFSDAIVLIGWRVQPDSETLKVSIVWQAKRALDRRYTAFVHLENSDGKKIAQQDREPRGGLYPTTRWAANEFVRENYGLNVSKESAGEKFILKVGWYDLETGDRLSVPGNADDAVILQDLEGF